MYLLPTIFRLAPLVYESSSTIDKQVIIYPGRFQPFHRGHASVYHYLCDKHSNADVYIATSGVVDPVKSPFTFDQKRQMMLFAGIPDNAIVHVKNPYVAQEIMSKYDASRTGLMFAISQKDMESDPRFAFRLKKDGSQPYLQPLKTTEPEQSAAHHGYMTTIPTLSFKVNGVMVNSASQIREQYKRATAKERKRIIFDLYGKLSPEIESIFDQALTAN